jgi:hypothetical protein
MLRDEARRIAANIAKLPELRTKAIALPSLAPFSHLRKKRFCNSVVPRHKVPSERNALTGVILLKFWGHTP